MKLIDADALNDRIDKCVTLSGVGLEPLMAVRDIKALISVMPTIDAIPVEWIRGQMARCHENSAMHQTANTLLQLWQNEQEAR